MSAARTVRHAPLRLHGQRVMLRSLTENDFDEWHEVRTRCAPWLLRWEPRPKGAPVPSEDRPSFAARCGIRERERHLGAQHPDTLRVQLNLLLTEHELRVSGALEKRQSIIGALSALTGSDDPDVITAIKGERLLPAIDPLPF